MTTSFDVADYPTFHGSVRRATMDKTAITLEAISKEIVDLVFILRLSHYYLAFPGNIMLCIKLQNRLWVWFFCFSSQYHLKSSQEIVVLYMPLQGDHLELLLFLVNHIARLE